MRTNSIEKLPAALPYLAVITVGAERTRRRGRVLRTFRPESVLSAEATAACVELAKLGHVVKVKEASRILTPTVVADGAVVWGVRETCVNRASGESRLVKKFGMETAVVVEVAL